jgi:chitin disaccharide deacetylase
MTGRYLIVNADDFGQSRGINRGIVECHQRGIVTSTSLMVTGRALDEATELSKANTRLAIGLHFDVWGEDEREFDTHDLPATRDELRRQLDRFGDVMGRHPTHIDSHRHAHREEHLFPHFLEWTAHLGVPVRGDGRVNFVGGFYAQWEWKVTNLAYVGVPFLRQMLLNEVPPGFTEFSCHPGYVSGKDDDYHGVYFHEREAEVVTLTDPSVREFIAETGIHLASYADYATLRSA